MRVELNLVENSYDFLLESIELYTVADMDDTHDPQRANIKYQKKLKNAFVLLVQAIELILKEALNKINPVLVFENIDAPNIKGQKTIQYSKSLERIMNLKRNLLTIKEKEFLECCGKLRNEFIHFKPNFESFDIKRKYCELYAIYKKIFFKVTRKKIEFEEEKYKYTDDTIMKKSQDLILFRGMEFNKKHLKWYEKELRQSQQYSFLYDKKSKKFYDRIKYGCESQFIEKICGDSSDIYQLVDEFDYCGDCAAKHGEYHLTNCDWEICPKCGGQLLGCSCELDYTD